jgi:hypothetical protein
LAGTLAAVAGWAGRSPARQRAAWSTTDCGTGGGVILGGVRDVASGPGASDGGPAIVPGDAWAGTPALPIKQSPSSAAAAPTVRPTPCVRPIRSGIVPFAPTRDRCRAIPRLPYRVIDSSPDPRPEGASIAPGTLPY